MRIALTAAAVALMAAPAAAWGAGLTITPVSPAPGDVLRVGDTAALVLRTAPGAVCYADIQVSGAATSVHKSAERAGENGVVSWRPDDMNSTGTREVTASCTLNGERAQIRWTFSVE
jgi:hypothetical protein